MTGDTFLHAFANRRGHAMTTPRGKLGNSTQFLSTLLMTAFLLHSTSGTAARAQAQISALSAQRLIQMSGPELDALYRQGTSVGIPPGRVRGTAPAGAGNQAQRGPGARHAPDLAGQGVRAGRSVSREPLLRSADDPGPGFSRPELARRRPALVLDYSRTSRVYAQYRDEIRQVAPGLFLGLMYARTTPQPTLRNVLRARVPALSDHARKDVPESSDEADSGTCFAHREDHRETTTGARSCPTRQRLNRHKNPGQGIGPAPRAPAPIRTSQTRLAPTLPMSARTTRRGDRSSPRRRRLRLRKRSLMMINSRLMKPEVMQQARPIGDADDRDPSVARNLERLAWLMDRAFTIPGTKITVGLDALLGLLPVGGDVLTGIVQAALVLIALRHYRVPRSVAARMMGNVALDVALGSIPLLGDLFDVAFQGEHQEHQAAGAVSAAVSEGSRGEAWLPRDIRAGTSPARNALALRLAHRGHPCAAPDIGTHRLHHRGPLAILVAIWSALNLRGIPGRSVPGPKIAG